MTWLIASLLLARIFTKFRTFKTCAIQLAFVFVCGMLTRMTTKLTRLVTWRTFLNAKILTAMAAKQGAAA